MALRAGEKKLYLHERILQLQSGALIRKLFMCGSKQVIFTFLSSLIKLNKHSQSPSRSLVSKAPL